MTKMAKRGFFLGAMVVSVSLLTIYLTIDIDSLKSLKDFNSYALFFALVCLGVGLFFDGLRLQRLVKLAGFTLSLKAMLQVIASNYFMALLTPGAAGGAVAQVLLLKGHGVPISTATPIVLVRTIFSIAFLIFALPFIFFMDSITIPYISNESLLLLSFLGIVALIGGIYFLQTNKSKKVVFWLAESLKKVSTREILKEFDNLNKGLALLYKEPKQTLLVFLESATSLLLLYAIAPVLLSAFTDTVPWIDILNRMILLNLILYFAPTPGGSGIAEALFVFFFSAYVPLGTIGIIAVAWRIVAEYIPFFFGMYGMITYYGRKYLT